MPPARFEPTISAGERPQTYALDRDATGTGMKLYEAVTINSTLDTMSSLQTAKYTAQNFRTFICLAHK